jgi:hypothetical protein
MRSFIHIVTNADHAPNANGYVTGVINFIVTVVPRHLHT